MTRLVMLALSALVVVGCGGAASASPSAAPVSASAGSPSPSPSTSAVAGSPSSTGGTALRLFDCHPDTYSNACPMAPGRYVADIHDRFSLEIQDPGWQEEETLPKDQDGEPTLRLDRTADPDQRLIIDTGPTGGIVTDTQLLPDLTGLQVGPPKAVTIGGTTGLQVDLVPTKSTELSVPRVSSARYQLEPGTTYRLAVTQLPMGEESGIKVILMSAPTAAWGPFSELADAVVQTLQFE